MQKFQSETSAVTANLKKTSEITEDDMKKAEKKVQTFTDDSCAEIEKLCSAKTTQTMEI